MSDHPFPFFSHRNMRMLKSFNIVRHHEDGDRQLCQFWCTSMEEAAIEAVTSLAVAGWHIDSIIMNCEDFDEEELFYEITQQNFDAEFFKIIEDFNES